MTTFNELRSQFKNCDDCDLRTLLGDLVIGFPPSLKQYSNKLVEEAFNEWQLFEDNPENKFAQFEEERQDEQQEANNQHEEEEQCTGLPTIDEIKEVVASLKQVERLVKPLSSFCQPDAAIIHDLTQKWTALLPVKQMKQQSILSMFKHKQT